MTPGTTPGERGPKKEPGFGSSLWTFSLRVLLATALAALAMVVALRWWGRGRVRTEGAGSPVVAAPSPPPGERVGERRQRPLDAPLPSTSPVSAPARDVERRHAAGALSEAHKRFEPCPGGDVRRLAWIDARSGVVKLVRERDDGVTLEEWFDDEGRLREAAWEGHADAARWGRRVTIDADGRETAADLVGGAVPRAPPPSLDRRDPTAAFFSGPNCAR